MAGRVLRVRQHRSRLVPAVAGNLLQRSGPAPLHFGQGEGFPAGKVAGAHPQEATLGALEAHAWVGARLGVDSRSSRTRLGLLHSHQRSTQIYEQRAQLLDQKQRTPLRVALLDHVDLQRDIVEFGRLDDQNERDVAHERAQAGYHHCLHRPWRLHHGRVLRRVRQNHRRCHVHHRRHANGHLLSGNEGERARSEPELLRHSDGSGERNRRFHRYPHAVHRRPLDSRRVLPLPMETRLLDRLRLLYSNQSGLCAIRQRRSSVLERARFPPKREEGKTSEKRKQTEGEKREKREGGKCGEAASLKLSPPLCLLCLPNERDTIVPPPFVKDTRVARNHSIVHISPPFFLSSPSIGRTISDRRRVIERERNKRTRPMQQCSNAASTCSPRRFPRCYSSYLKIFHRSVALPSSAFLPSPSFHRIPVHCIATRGIPIAIQIRIPTPIPTPAPTPIPIPFEQCCENMQDGKV